MKPAKKKRVFIVDDHPFVREGLKQIIDQQPDLVVCGEAATAAETLDSLKTTHADIVILDLALEDRSGLELIKEIRQWSSTLPILVLSMYDENLHAERVLRIGANGYVMKRESPPTLLAAIHKVLGGQCYLSHTVSARLLGRSMGRRITGSADPMERLSDRELEVFELLGQGERRGTIAKRLNLSVKTVESHCHRIKQKLGLHNAEELRQRAYLWIREDRPQQPATGLRG